MNKTKTILSPSQMLFYSDNIIEKLEKLALEGWRLKKFNAYTITLEECEPKPIKYSVIFSPDSSTLDEKPTQPQEELIELCKDSGWEYVVMRSQMLIFSSELEDTTPIDSDEQVKLNTIHKSMKKEALPGYFINVGIMILMLAMQLITFKAEDFYTSVQLYLFGLFPVVIIHGILNIIQYYDWYSKSKNSVEKGGICVKPINISWLNYVTMTMTIVMILGFVASATSSKIPLIGLPIFIGNFCICYGTINLLRKKDYKTSTKWKIYAVMGFIVTISSMAFISRLVFNMVDSNDYYTQFDKYQYTTTEDSSILASRKSYYIKNTTNDLSMSIRVYDSNLEFVNNQILSGVLKLEDWQLESNTSWKISHQDNTHTIYTKYIDNEIHIYDQILATDNKVFDINFDADYTQEERELIITKLLELK